MGGFWNRFERRMRSALADIEADKNVPAAPKCDSSGSYRPENDPLYHEFLKKYKRNKNVRKSHREGWWILLGDEGKAVVQCSDLAFLWCHAFYSHSGELRRRIDPERYGGTNAMVVRSRSMCRRSSTVDQPSG